MDHFDAEYHHHHSHAAASHHPGRHHLLSVEGLSVSFDMYDSDAPYFRAPRVRQEVLRDLTVSVHAGEVLAVVGASGSGKTVLADSIMGSFPRNAYVTGRIWFDGQLQDAPSLRRLCGRGISLMPQGSQHLDPTMPVGLQVLGRSRSFERRRAMERLFSSYGLDHGVMDLYPYELSGGMIRRVLLMCALMDNPRLIIADEPTPGLDLDLAVHALDDLRGFADQGGAVMLITHDIELALRVADRVAVFAGGTVVEETSVKSFEDPTELRHPFSRALWHAMPEHDFCGEGACK